MLDDCVTFMYFVLSLSFSPFCVCICMCSALGYIVGSQVSNLVQTYAHQDVSWRWALRVSDCMLYTTRTQNIPGSTNGLNLLQVTPTLGIVAFLLVLLVMREPPRGHTDGQMSTKGVRGKTGVKAYVDDVIYCIKK